MNSNRVFTRYGSYYTAYPNIPSSYAVAANGNCNKNVKGQTVWTGIVANKNGVDIYGSGFGNNCDEARSDFCQKNGGCLGKTGQKPIVGTAEPFGGSESFTKAALGGNDTPASKAVDSVGKTIDDATHGDPGKNAVSGCTNCNGDWWNPGNWGCQLGKMGCEFQQAVGGTGNGIQQFLKDNIIFIAGGFVGIIILSKLLKVF
jgi:hypothetical protein